MKMTKDIEYAVISLVTLAESDVLLSARELSKRFSIPYELLSKILQSLCQKGIVESVKGPKGGYRLNGELKNFSLGDIDEALHGDSILVPCLTGAGEKSEGLCAMNTQCSIKHGMAKVQHLWEEMLSSISLEEFILREAYK